MSHYSATLRLGVPIAIGQLGVIILGFADTLMVGRYSTDALAASAFVNNLFTLFTFLLMGYSYGLTPIVSALFGQGKQAEAGEQLKPALLSGTVFCLLLMAVWGIAFFNLEHFGQPDELLPLIRPYFLVILVSMIFVMLYNELRQFTDGLTHTTLGMYTLMIGNALNIVGNWLLIYGPGPFPEMGLLGAGIATLLARVLMVVLMVAALWWKKGYAPYREGFARCRASLDGMRAIVRASLPIAIQMGLECAAFTMSAVMAGWVGKVELAAYQVMVTIGTLGFLLYYSFGAGTSIRVANFYGQHDRTNVFHAGAAGRNLLFLMAACSSLLIYLLAEPLIRVFTTDTAVIAISLSLIPFLVLYQFADAMQICYANILRGTGHVLAMVRIAIISYLIVNIPAAFILGFSLGWGVKGIFLAFFIGLFTAATLFFKEYRKAMR
ncbi:MAG: MATE family efflux transporter [Bacteroidales bacterium]|nr:MATE family efflux transporter [Bacteroidales bacterium]